MFKKKKKKEAIWYDWNSPSGFELFETNNAYMAESLKSREIVKAVEIEELELVACDCNCRTRLSVVR